MFDFGEFLVEGQTQRGTEEHRGTPTAAAVAAAAAAAAGWFWCVFGVPVS